MFEISLKVKKGIFNPKIETINVKPSESIYFMGICGTAMSSLAFFLQKEGFNVSGSDQNIYPPISTLLESYKIPIYPYKKENIFKDIKLVIIGNVIKKTNSEVKKLDLLGIPYVSLPDFLEQTLLSKKKNIVACGTHGKSTMTSLMAHIGSVAGLSPGCFVGGVSQDLTSSFYVTGSEWFIIEGDEYDTAFFAKYPKFFHYNPFALIMTDIELDHLDIYKNINEILDVFYKLVKKVPKNGVICIHSQNKWLDDIKKRAQAPVITYGFNEGDYYISPPQLSLQGTKFDIKHQGKTYPCEIHVHGYHNILNALAAFSLSHYLKWPEDKILKGLKSFKGMKRRLQKRGEVNGITLFEDFAHHPTSLKITLKSLKELYSKNKLFVIFEPRTFTSCTSFFQKEYTSSFKYADVIFLYPPFNKKNIPKDNRFSSETLVQDLKVKGKVAFLLEDKEIPAEKLIPMVQKGDVIVLISNGDLESRIQSILNKLREA